MHIDRFRRATESTMFCIQKDTNLKYFPNVGIKKDWRGVYSSLKVPVSKKDQWTVTFRVSDTNGATTNQPVDISGFFFNEPNTTTPTTENSTTINIKNPVYTNYTYFANPNQMVSKPLEEGGPCYYLMVAASGSDAVAFSQFYFSIGSHVFNIFEENAKQLIQPYLSCFRQGKIYADFMSLTQGYLSWKIRQEKMNITIERCINDIARSTELIPHIHDVHEIPMWLSTHFDDIHGIGFGYKETVQDREFMSALVILIFGL